MYLPVRRLARPAAAACAWVLLFAAPAVAQNAVTEEGLFVTVPHPISSTTISQIRSQVEGRLNNAALNAGGRPIRKVVFDFNPNGKDVVNPDFWACSGLAEEIGKLKAKVTTIAFVHAKASGHTVLPVLACQELVMSRGGSLGEVVSDAVPGPLEDNKKRIYQEVCEGNNRKAQFAAVRKMFDPGVALGRGVLRQGGAPWLVDLNNPAEVALVAGTEPVEFAQPGVIRAYTAEQARQLGLCKAIAENRAEVAERYELSPASIGEDVLQGRAPEAFRYTLTGKVDGGMRESLGRIVRDVKRRGNVLVLTLDCSGDDLESARAIADDLREAQTGENPILVIAYIPERAPDAATFIAFGCTDIVMSRRRDTAEPDRPDDHKEAEIGDFEAVVKGGKPGTVDAHRKSLRELAEKRGIPAIVVDGMFDKDLEIVRAVRPNNRTQKRLMSRADLEAQEGEWQPDGVVKQKGRLLALTASQAAELGVARYTVDRQDPAEVYAIYGLTNVREVTPGWLDRFAEFLRLPVVAVLLVVIGVTGLILELKVPGLTVPGIVAALCFILFFWSQSRFSGEMFVLALLLFILGLVLVGLEVFVLPGFGAPGIFGILCMLAGLGLVTFERIPQTGEEWGSLGVRVSQYMFGMIGAFFLAFLIARFLPKVPYANRLMLVPPGDKPEAAESALPGVGEAAGLLGAIGTTNTTLRPAGVVRFADKFVDVVSDGGFIPAGTRVQVIAVEGTRIVVKEV